MSARPGFLVSVADNADDFLIDWGSCSVAAARVKCSGRMDLSSLHESRPARLRWVSPVMLIEGGALGQHGGRRGTIVPLSGFPA